ncbi:L-dopachrome tautomerase-related protein [Spirosoma radiotolerans]|uniref:L-dopachrome tautomerase-related protein n=1 Tax=Spirosoma radiotolerans TaxID=1379870 RepID=UPI0006272F21|nr:L-dopachrome tautomerase-related protein [Spirosoma radiotolerans]
MKYTLLLSLFLLNPFVSDAQSSQSPQLETVAQFGKHQPIGLGVSQPTPSSAARIFVTFPKNPDNYDYGLAEISTQAAGVDQRRPYPNAEWNKWDSLNPQNRFINVQALFVDNTNALWVLDPASPAGQRALPEGIKLLKINLSTNQVEKIYRFEDLPRERTGLNDVQIDTRRQMAYLSDPGRAAIVVLDLKTGKSRTVLENDKSTKADPAFVLTIEGKEVRDTKGNPFRSNVNGIALTHDFNFLYFRPITQTKLFRIATNYLVDPTLTPAQLASHVEVMGETGVSHGMIADKAGNVYLTDSPNKAIKYVTPDKQLKTLVQDDRLLWPDSFGISADGYLYVTAAQIQRTKRYNNGEDKVAYPFRLYRVKLPK